MTGASSDIVVVNLTTARSGPACKKSIVVDLLADEEVIEVRK